MKFFRKYPLLFLIVGGLLIRFLYAYIFPDLLLEGDAGYYTMHAHDILEGNDFKPEWPPGLSYWLAGFAFVFGEYVFSEVLAMLMVYVLFSWFLYKALCLFFAETYALAGVCFFSLSPTFIHHSVAPLTQLPIACCLVGILYFLIKKREGWKIGLFMAVAILTRAGSLALLPVVLAYLFYQKRYRALPGLIAVLLILIGSWQYKSYQMTDRWVWINDFNSYNFFVGNNESTPDYKTWWLGSHEEREAPEFNAYYVIVDSVKTLPAEQQSEAYSSLSWKYIHENPGTFIYRSFNRLRTFYAFDTYTGASLYTHHKALGMCVLVVDAGMFIMLVLSFLLGWGANPKFPFHIQGLLLLLVLAYTLPYLLAFSHPTYHLPIMPLLMFFALQLKPSFSVISAWKESPQYFRLLIGFFLFIQIEWIWHMADRLG